MLQRGARGHESDLQRGTPKVQCPHSLQTHINGVSSSCCRLIGGRLTARSCRLALNDDWGWRSGRCQIACITHAHSSVQS